MIRTDFSEQGLIFLAPSLRFFKKNRDTYIKNIQRITLQKRVPVEMGISKRVRYHFFNINFLKVLVLPLDPFSKQRTALDLDSVSGG